MFDKIEMSHRAAENLRKYKRMFAEQIWKERKYKTIPEILDELDIPRCHFNNVTNPDKIKPGSENVEGPDGRNGRPYSLDVPWLQKVVWAYGDWSVMVELVKDCGGLCLTPQDLKELEEIDLSDTDKIGKVLRKLKAITGSHK